MRASKRPLHHASLVVLLLQVCNEECFLSIFELWPFWWEELVSVISANVQLKNHLKIHDACTCTLESLAPRVVIGS
jgi:hypothetical protein